MGWMAGVLDDPPGFPYTPPGVDVLEGGKLTSNNVAGSSHNPLQSFAVASGAVPNQAVMQPVRMLSTVQVYKDLRMLGLIPTSSAVSGRRGVDVTSSALHLCERTM